MCFISIIPATKSIAMGFPDLQIVSTTNEPLQTAQASVQEAKIKFEKQIEDIYLQTRILELYRKLLQTKIEVLKSATETKATSHTQDLDDFWQALVETNHSFEKLFESIRSWQREINGQNGEAHKFFSLNLANKVEEIRTK